MSQHAAFAFPHYYSSEEHRLPSEAPSQKVAHKIGNALAEFSAKSSNVAPKQQQQPAVRPRRDSVESSTSSEGISRTNSFKRSPPLDSDDGAVSTVDQAVLFSL